MWTCEHQGVIRQEQNDAFWQMVVAFCLGPLKLNGNCIDVSFCVLDKFLIKNKIHVKNYI